jgi:hypothetical protein
MKKHFKKMKTECFSCFTPSWDDDNASINIKRTADSSLEQILLKFAGKCI